MPKETKKKPEKNEIATHEKDIDIFAGWINRLENPDPVLRTESKGKGLKLYDEVDRDAHAGAVLQTRYLSVVGKEWNIEPAEPAKRGRGRPGSETQEQKIADFVEEAIKNTNWDQAIAELLQAILYGYYVAEIMWDYSEGDIWIDKLLVKHPRRFSFTPERELRLLTRQSMIDGEPVPDRKFVVFSYGSTDNPYGRGLGQKLWWPVWFKKNGVKFWMMFAETFGSPTPIGKYPPGTSTPDQELLLDVVESFQQAQAGIIPETMKIDLIEAARTSSINTYDTLCKFMNAQISKAVLGQTLTTEIGDKGSYAASQTHDDVRSDILKADADALAEVLNATVIRWLVDYNFPDVAGYPKLWYHTVEEQDLKPLAERDKILVKDIGLRVGEQYFYNAYNLPRPEEGDELVAPPQPMGPGFKEPNQKSKGKRQKEYQEETLDDGQDDVDRLIDRAVREGAPLFREMLETVGKAAEEAGSIGILSGDIPELLDRIPSAALADHLAQNLLAADMIGRGSVETGAEFQEARWGPGTPFAEAIDYFRDQAFTISGITKAELLSEIKDELIKAMEEGRTVREFQKSLPEIFERHGYKPLNPWRIKTIYQTNLQDAFQAGRLEQTTRPEIMAARPYWRYIAVRDGATRPSHLEMHGKVFRADDPVWESWYPPNGFNCRCSVQTVSAREVEREGYNLETEDPTGKPFFPIDPETGGRLPPRLLMPDQGWGHMPGRRDLKAMLEEKRQKLRV